nr:DUF3263 domain-containing protein [Frondihabitans sp. 762G35]
MQARTRHSSNATGVGATSHTGGVTETEERVLDFEAAHPNGGAHATTELWNELHMGRVRYQQILSRLITTQEALARHPMLVKRLLRRADAAAERRSRRTLA